MQPIASFVDLHARTYVLVNTDPVCDGYYILPGNFHRHEAQLQISANFWLSSEKF